MDVNKMKSKHLYSTFVYDKREIPTAEDKWVSKFDISPECWKVIYKVPYSCMKDTALQSFQYRVLHRVIPCKKWLCVMSLVESELCPRCKSIDTIEHFLYSCPSVKHFWNMLEQWWNLNSPHKAQITEKHVIFGIFYDLKHFSCINYIIILAKYYIYKQSLNEKVIAFNNFLILLKQKLETEENINK